VKKRKRVASVSTHAICSQLGFDMTSKEVLEKTMSLFTSLSG